MGTSQIPVEAGGTNGPWTPKDPANGARSWAPSAEPPARRKVEWHQAWFDFSQNTSFAGIKQVTEAQPFLLRRLLWACIFLAGLVLFLIQAAYSIQYYLQWPMTVDVKINYNDTIQFPTITICNENAFRATEAYRLGLYDLITDLYSENGENHVDADLLNASALTLSDLYYLTKHKKEDFIFKCEWDKSPCHPDDFTTTFTDFGVCYTFNDRHRRQDGKRVATETGTEGGLRLQLNIEQYEYMRGPNEGAGVKLLVHESHDIPLVRDHGLAVASGMHAFLALKILEVHNLPPPHGKCNDSVTLEHFEHYTQSNCRVNCLQNHMLEKCGCRDMYMPDRQGDQPVCDLKQFQECLKPQLKEAHDHSDEDEEEECDCPVPCNRVMFEPLISYVSTSNFDIDKLLGSNVTEVLSKKYVHAREVNQRTSEQTSSRHKRLVDDVGSLTSEIDAVLRNITTNIHQASDLANTMREEMKNRARFHYSNGLQHVEYVLEHDFIRGWEVCEERVLNFITADFISVYETVLRTINWINDTIPADDVTRRADAWWPVRSSLESKRKLLEKARGNVTTTDHAYRTGEPLLTYRVTLDRRYDMSYVSVELLQKGASRQQEYVDALIAEIDNSQTGLAQMQAAGEDFVHHNQLDQEKLASGENWYVDGSKGINYRLFLFKERIVHKPLTYMEERLTQFLTDRDTLWADFAVLQDQMTKTKDAIENIHKHWARVHYFVEEALAYETDVTRNKTHLAEIATSVAMGEDIRQLKILFSTLRSRGEVLSEHFYKTSASYQQLWRTMVSESSTKPFYEMLHNDTTDFFANTSTSEFYMPYFRDLLIRKEEALMDEDPQLLWTLLNADFHTMDLSQKLSEVSAMYEQLEMSCRITEAIGDKDEMFLQAFDKLTTSLHKFLEKNEINQDFYKENFLHLDIFMQELSYQEIIQQEAYDIPRLLGDIGGSMGLFIGGSALSLFEFFDVILHNGARLLFNQ